MILENRTERKFVVGLLFFVYTVAVLSFGYLMSDLSIPAIIVYIIGLVALSWLLQTVVVLDALYSDREHKVEA